jgi:hypothetical protein
MKFIRFTYVDALTGTPVSQEPAKNGPSLPEGLVPTFDIEEARSTGIPQVYGFVEDSEEEPFPLQQWVSEVSEEEFFQTFKNELKERARKKRKQVEQGGIIVGDSFIGTTIEDQNRVSGMATTLVIDPEMEEIDFEYAPNQWIAISREIGLMIGVGVARHVQSCFSWCRSIHNTIDALELDINSLDQVLPILEEINSFGQPVEEIPEEEEQTSENTEE